MKKNAPKNGDFLKKDDASYKAIAELAQKKGVSVKDFINDSENDGAVIDTLYPLLPKYLRMFTSKNAFAIGYGKKKQSLISQLEVLGE